MIAPIYSDFLVLWDTLAKADTCPELKNSWNQILEHAETIEFEGLNELWNFYLERLCECGRGKAAKNKVVPKITTYKLKRGEKC